MRTLQLLVASTLLLCSCNSPDHVASFVDPASGTSIAIELRHAHPTLAEYDRTVVLSSSSQPATRFELQMDSGGYGTTNLYRCSSGQFMLIGYEDSVVLEPDTGLIQRTRCSGSRTYLGVFDGGGSKPWRYYSALERGERKLVMSGG